MQLPNHGANPHRLYEQFGWKRPARVLDFSENVNPVGPPQQVKELWPDLWTQVSHYPEPTGEPFRSAAARFHGISTDALFVGNGAAELLALLAERYRGKKAIIVHPTFSEYEATLQAKQVEIIHVLSKEVDDFVLPIAALHSVMEEAAVLYLCTPNNPTGVLPSQAELLELIHHAMRVNCELVLDEAFIDFVDESLSFISKVSTYPHVIVIRSMTKMYAIPGIRLGYIVASPVVISEIKAVAPHWNVNGIAAVIGESCLKEVDYRQQAIEASHVQREQMKRFLQENNCTVTKSVANFLTFKVGEKHAAKKLYTDLLQRGLVLRHSENFRGMDGQWLRVGMKKPTDMAVLQKELTKWFAEN